MNGYAHLRSCHEVQSCGLLREIRPTHYALTESPPVIDALEDQHVAGSFQFFDWAFALRPDQRPEPCGICQCGRLSVDSQER